MLAFNQSTTSESPALVRQKELEALFSKNQLMPRLREEFRTKGGEAFKAFCAEKEIPYDFAVDLLVQMSLHKRAKLVTLVGILYHFLGSAQATADMLEKCNQADLVDYDTVGDKFILKFDISPEVQADIERFQYPLPMVVEPKEITNNSESGYLLNNRSVILRNNHHKKDVCLKHLNTQNAIKFKINEQVAKTIKNRWRNLDKPKVGETKDKFEQRKRAFEKYDRTAQQIMKLLTEVSPHFYLTHQYDKRGRTYPAGYHVNYAGNPWNKATIEFADTELVV